MKNTSWLSPYKAVHHMDVLQGIACGNGAFPVHIEIHPTTECNHRCKRCAAVIPKIKGKKRPKLAYRRNTEIPLERFLRLIDEFADAGVKAITLCGGGEPLIYRGIRQVLRRILERRLDLGIITNLNIPLDDELLGLLRRAVFVRVSLDAAKPETYLELHRPIDGGDFQRVTDNILAVRNPGLDLGINYLVQEENYRDIASAAALAGDLGTTYIRFTPAHTLQEGKEYIPLWDEITEQFNKAGKHDSEAFTVLGAVSRFKNMVENRKDYERCIYHELHPIVGADLNVYPCCVLNYFQGYEMVSLSELQFHDAWRSAGRKAFSERLDPRVCPPCWFDEQNRLLNYITLREKRHANFL